MIICYTDPEIWRMTDVIFFFFILGYFLPFYRLTAGKTRIKKTHLAISSFYTCAPQMTTTWCMVPKMWSTPEFFVTLDQFLPFYPTNNPENQNYEKMKKKKPIWRYHHFTLASHIMIIWCTIREICSATDKFFAILDQFYLFIPPTTQKTKILKKCKKLLNISSFYTIVP